MRKYLVGVLAGAIVFTAISYSAQVYQYIQFAGDLAGSTWNSQTLAAGSVNLAGSKVTGTLPLGNGGTGLASASDDTVLVSNGTIFQAKAVPDCDDTGGNHLNYDTTTNVLSCGTSGGGGGTPGGSNTQVQFNDSSAFGGDADYTWVKATNVLSIGSVATPGSIITPAASGSNNGPTLVVKAGDGGASGGTGGALNLTGGVGGTAGIGGDILIKAGDSPFRAGDTLIRLGDGTTQDGTFVVQGATSLAELFKVSYDGTISFNSAAGTTGQPLLANSAGSPTWGTLAVTGGGTGLATVAQGDLPYASASNTISALAKNTTATRYLSNTGTTNNPAWAQVNLTNGVTGSLPFANTALLPVSVITAAGAVTITTSMYFVCINKTVGAATAANLPSSPSAGRQYVVSDCKGDAATNNITVTPAAGNVDGAGTKVISANYGSWYGYYTGTIWKTIAVQ